MMKSIKEHLSTKTETVLSELNECFKVVSASLVPSERGIYITDHKVQTRLVVESYFPKDVVCTKAAISIEYCKVCTIDWPKNNTNILRTVKKLCRLYCSFFYLPFLLSLFYLERLRTAILPRK